MGRFRSGWRPDKKDHRDLEFHDFLDFAPLVVNPSSDLESLMPHVYDQAQEGSCTAQAAAAYVQFLRKKTNLGAPTPSRNFIYYNTRLLEGDPGSDSGGECRDALKTLTKYGWCVETPTWPYTEADLLVKPSAAAYTEAKGNIVPAPKYMRVRQTAGDICLALSRGLPVYFGFYCTAAIDDPVNVAKTGYLPTPKPTDKIIGGHAVLLVGHDLSKSLFKWRNSWGTSWGKNGYGTMSFDYVLNSQLSSDFWVMVG